MERTLWLDADTVVRCDLSHLFAGAGAAPWHLEEPVVAVALRDAARSKGGLNQTISRTLRRAAAAGSGAPAGPIGPPQREALRQCVPHAGGAFNAGVSLLCEGWRRRSMTNSD